MGNLGESKQTLRVEALRQYGLLDTKPESFLDGITTLAAHVAKAPIATISVFDQERQLFKSSHGIEATEGPATLAICHCVVVGEEPLVIPNTQDDNRFKENVYVCGPPHVRSYAGVPLWSPGGIVLGSLCVIDKRPRDYTAEQVQMLRLLAEQVVHQMELRRTTADLEEQKESLQRSNDVSRRLAAVVESSNDAIATMNRSGFLTSWNRAAEDLFGYKSHEILGEHVSILIPFRFVKRSLYILDRLADGEPINHFEAKRVHANGKEIDVSIAMSPLLDAESKLVGFSKIVRDITERKKAEGELAQAKIKAQQASVAKTQFLANVSHEIRTPMHGLLGMTDVLLGTDLTSEQRDGLEIVKASTLDLKSLIDELLDFSKIESGKVELQDAPYSISAIARGAVKLFAQSALQKNIDLVVQISPEVPKYVHGDPNRIRQILNNLVSNAVKFTDEGKVQIELQVEVSEDLERRLRIEVIDTGIGLPPGSSKSVFEPFTQADGSITREYGGTGLGLAICKQLVTLLEGQIGVQSEEGIGSTFWFCIPMRPALEPRGQEAGHGARISNPDDSDEPPRTVLVVEDNAINRRVVSAMLGQLGYRIDSAINGDEALRKLDAQRFDVVLMDCQMPVMDGLEATRKLRERKCYNNLPVIAMTAQARSEERDACIAAGMDDHLVKPVTKDMLSAMLSKHLSREPTPKTRGRASKDDAPSLDRGVLERLEAQTGGAQAGVVPELIQLFLNEVASDRPQLQSDFRAGRTEALAKRVHRLASSAANLGLVRMSLVCAGLERVAREQDGALMESLVAELLEEMERVVPLLSL